MEFTSTTFIELNTEYMSVINKIKKELMAEMKQLQENGDIEGIAELTNSAKEMLTNITDAYNQRMDDIQSGKFGDDGGDDEDLNIYGNERADIDLNALVYSGDRDYAIALENDEVVKEVLDRVNQNNGSFASRKHLLKHSLRLTRVLAPELYAIGDECTEALKLKNRIEFFVYQDETFNASCYPPDSDTLYIMVSSGLLEKFSKEELKFVIGHEIGHVLFEHFKFPIQAILNEGEDDLSPLNIMKLYAWNRNAEISADRAGLVCVKDFVPVASSFFKLSSGVTTATLDFHLSEYVGQFSDLEKVLSDPDVDPSDWYTTHPFSPLRIKALDIFKDSDVYHEFAKMDVSAASVESEAMEAEINRFMSLMQPDYLDDESDNGKKIQEFIFMCGYLVALSDGHVDDSELESLSTMVSARIFATCMQEIQGHGMQEMIDKVCNMAGDITVMTSVMQRLNILRDLCLIAQADGVIDEGEVYALYQISNQLQIRPEFIDRTLSEAQEVD